MGKIVKDSYRVAEEGVHRFYDYCIKHKPFIIFREVTKHDFGIDGELELTRTNEEGKTETTARTLKVQLKAVNTDNSYIKNETSEKFDFYADKDDLEYWLEHKKYGLPVLLVIVDLRENNIYVKKITELEIHATKNKGRQLPILFDKKSNKLEFGINDFIERFDASFQPRVNFIKEETLMTNSLVIKKYPTALYVNRAKFKTKKGIYQNIDGADTPHFTLKGDHVFSFRELNDKNCKLFCDKILSENKNEVIHIKNILQDVNLTNIYLELIYEHIKHDVKQKHLNFSKDYHKFYFWLKQTEDILEVDTRSRKRGQDKKKKVVTKHTYGDFSFFRHWAVEFKVKLHDNGIYLIVNPKYLFTKDRKEPLSPKLITKYTNFLTSREYNDVYANNLHFWKTYLFKGEEFWEIFASDKINIVIGDYQYLKVNFGINIDVKSRKKASIETNQEKLEL